MLLKCIFQSGLGGAMRLRMQGVFLLLLLPILLIVGAPSVLAQTPTEAELEALNRRAIALSQAGKYGEAIPLAERFGTAVKAQYSGDAPEYAIAINNLAQLYQETTRFTEAELLMRRALAIDEKAYGSNHPNVARDLNNLVRLLQDTSRLAEAEQFVHRALAIDEKAYGPNHPNVARDLNNLQGDSKNRLHCSVTIVANQIL